MEIFSCPCAQKSAEYAVLDSGFSSTDFFAVVSMKTFAYKPSSTQAKKTSSCYLD